MFSSRVLGQLFTLGNPADIPAQDFVQDATADLIFVSVAYRFGLINVK